MLLDLVSNQGPLAFEADALPIALCCPALHNMVTCKVVYWFIQLMLVAVINGDGAEQRDRWWVGAVTRGTTGDGVDFRISLARY